MGDKSVFEEDPAKRTIKFVMDGGGEIWVSIKKEAVEEQLQLLKKHIILWTMAKDKIDALPQEEKPWFIYHLLDENKEIAASVLVPFIRAWQVLPFYKKSASELSAEFFKQASSEMNKGDEWKKGEGNGE